MRVRQARVPMMVALLLAGCSAQPTVTATSSSVDPLGLGDAVAPRYQTLAAAATPVAIATVAASSTGTEITGFTSAASSTWSDKWFSVANLTDGNLHSAWEPAEHVMDTDPSLTLNLAGATTVTGLGIKMDAGATFDVAVNNGGTWTTIAANVTPQFRALDFISLPSSSATQVKLTFHVQADAKLLVCELKLFGGGSGSPAPSVAPSTSPMPTPAPTISPAASPTPSTIPSGRQCETLILSGEVFTSETFPVFSINLNATESTAGVFGFADFTTPTAANEWRGLVTGVNTSGNVVTVSGFVNLFSNVGPGQSIPFAVVSNITAQNGTSFNGVVTSVTFNGQNQIAGTITKPAVIQGSFAACLPNPTDCFTLAGDGLFFPNPSDPTFEVKLTNVTHSTSTTSGSVEITDFATGAKKTGTVNMATFQTNSVVLGGTLSNGGTFKLTTTVGDAQAPNNFGTTLTGITMTDASGVVAVDVSAAVQPNEAASFSGTLGCQ
ncbi:MAG: hypothetical protein JWM80_3299 [Cyanobacteria bacterium RYN_339]|nr:hypothetical protein [Cyanobacteria bacterium RYN_339]